MTMFRFFFNHIYISYVGYIIQTMIMIGFIWFKKTRDPSLKYKNGIMASLRVIPFGLMLAFGLIFIHAFMEIVIFGSYPYGAWMQTFPSAFLALICGVEWILAAVLVAPNVKTLITASTVSGIFFTYVYVAMPLSQDVWNVFNIVIILIGIYLFHGMLVLIERIALIVQPRFTGDRKLWDISMRFKKWFNWKTNLIIWVLLTMEFMCQIAGYSLITVFIG
ncbi:hypothetical protein GF325_00900 [Candidatus Bathyarchaeota archaeon]|nr:hypothetical protein [Candidatus Bathyarchaeota archaeon]